MSPVWLYDAYGPARYKDGPLSYHGGVREDEGQAREAARLLLTSGKAVSAVVEEARLSDVDCSYVRLRSWVASASEAGTVSWRRAAVASVA